MPWSTPKIDWGAGDGVANTDLNRIEGNAQYLKDDIDSHKADYEYQTPVIVGTQIRLQKQSDTNILKFKLDADLSGGAITISKNAGATSKPLLDIEGAAVIELSKGYVEVVEDVGNFTYAPKGGEGFPDGWNEKTVGRAWESIIKSDPVMLKKMGVWEDGVNKISDPSPLPSGIVTSVSFSPDRNYLAVGHSSSPYISVYKRNGDSFTRLSSPYSSSRPSGTVQSVSFSPDSNYLAIGNAGTPSIYIYKRSEDIFNKLEEPVTLPNSTNCRSVSFSPDGNYLAASSGNPKIIIYKRNGDIFNKLADPTVVPNGDVYSIAFSQDSNYLAIGSVSISGGAALCIYKRNGDIFNKLADPTVVPRSGTIYGVSFSPDSNYLAVGYGDSPFIIVYKRNGDVFNKLPDPAILPSQNGLSVDFSQDGNYLALGIQGTEALYIYKRNGDVFSKLPNSTTMPADTVRSVSFSSDGNYLAVSSGLIIYKSDVYDSIQKITAKNQYFNFSPPEWKFGIAMETLAIGETGKVTLFPKLNNLPNS